jgi:hypothetical protein
LGFTKWLLLVREARSEAEEAEEDARIDHAQDARGSKPLVWKKWCMFQAENLHETETDSVLEMKFRPEKEIKKLRMTKGRSRQSKVRLTARRPARMTRNRRNVPTTAFFNC